MAGSWILKGGVRLLTIGIVLVAGVAQGEQTPPTERMGISAVELKSVDLGPEIQGMEERHHRTRRGTLEPGGHNAIHTHADEPEVLYLFEGTITEHRNETTAEYRAGDVLYGTKNTSHWIENMGSTKTTILVVDIVKK